MNELLCIIGIPFVVCLLIKFVYVKMIFKYDVSNIDDVSLMSEVPDYDLYLKINDDILNIDI